MPRPDPSVSSTANASKPPRARLALEDGSVFSGTGFGDLRTRTVDGEVCFNTSLCGYQEILTDPSYTGQIVAMTYPLIGNYGVNEVDLESSRVHVRGFVVRELSNYASNYRATKKLEHWLAESQVTGIAGIDTRALTRKLRTIGALRGVLSTDDALSDHDLVERARQAPGLVDFHSDRLGLTQGVPHVPQLRHLGLDCSDGDFSTNSVYYPPTFW